MNRYILARCLHLPMLIFFLSIPSAVFTQEIERPLVIKYRTGGTVSLAGIPVTGFNSQLGDPVTELRFVGDLNIPIIGVLGQDGIVQAIDNETPLDAVLTSYASPQAYSGLFGIDQADSISNQNLDFSDLPQTLSLEGREAPIPQTKESSRWWEKSNGTQIESYTVGKWLSAKGRLKFVCSGKRGHHYEMRFKNLVPGGLYTAWMFVFDKQEGRLIADIPFGGASANVFSADRRGKAKTNQSLNFCPLNVEQEDRYQLIEICVVLHPDGKVYGGVPHRVLAPPFNGPGIIALPHLMFPIPDLSNTSEL